MQAQFDVPIAFFIFNRPDTTRRVFETIAAIKPRVLYIVADGARNQEEAKRCNEARKIALSVNWDCTVHENFSDINLGCKHRLNSGLSWVFEQCEKAIILEDDCLPDLSFFPYCKELLEKYEDNPSVVMISGAKIHDKLSAGKNSYYFSAFNHIWGWASWRRVWQQHDTTMSAWTTIKRSAFLRDILLSDSKAISYWRTIMQMVFDGKINTWDYQLLFSCWVHNGLTIIPGRNLVSNIGLLDIHATHPVDGEHNIDTGSTAMEFPLRHPRVIERSKINDITEMAIFHRLTVVQYIGSYLMRLGLDTKKIKKFLRM